MENTDDVGIRCNEHPDAPHGFMRDASHSAGRYVCECESWEPPKNKSEQKPVYTTPPKKEWVGLTDEEINSVCYKRDWTAPWTNTTFARAIEAKLKEKNHG